MIKCQNCGAEIPNRITRFKAWGRRHKPAIDLVISGFVFLSLLGVCIGSVSLAHVQGYITPPVGIYDIFIQGLGFCALIYIWVKGAWWISSLGDSARSWFNAVFPSETKDGDFDEKDQA